MIDLSYTAAYRIGVPAGGSALVEVESIIPDATGPSPAYAAGGSAPARISGGPDPSATRRQRWSPALVAARPRHGRPKKSDPILAIAAAAHDLDPVVEVPADLASPAATGGGSPLQAPVPSGSRGHYLQLGAFGSRENAESYLARAKLQLDWLAARLHVVPREGLFRVHAGPYASPAEARQIANRVALLVGVKPVLITR